MEGYIAVPPHRTHSIVEGWEVRELAEPDEAQKILAQGLTEEQAQMFANAPALYGSLGKFIEQLFLQFVDAPAHSPKAAVSAASRIAAAVVDADNRDLIIAYRLVADARQHAGNIIGSTAV